MSDIRNVIIFILVIVNASLVLLLFKPSGTNSVTAVAPSSGGQGGLDQTIIDGRKYKTAYEVYHVGNTITKNMGKLQECYLSFLERDHDILDGFVFVDWQIAPNGEANLAEVISTNLREDVFNNCIIDKVNEWTFPPPPSGRASYTSFRFRFATEEKRKKDLEEERKRQKEREKLELKLPGAP